MSGLLLKNGGGRVKVDMRKRKARREKKAVTNTGRLINSGLTKGSHQIP